MDDRLHPRPVRRTAPLRAAPQRPTHPVTRMQQHAGNRAVQRLLSDTTKSGAVPNASKAGGVPGATKAEAATDATKVGAAPTGGVGTGAAPGTQSPLVSPQLASDPALQACRQGQRNFRWGSRGESVTRIQQALIDLGYALPRFGADGEFGGETHQAVHTYQRDHGLTADGIVGRNTIGSLDAQLVARPPTPTGPPTPAPPTPGTQPPTTPPTPGPPTPAPPTPAPPTPAPPTPAGPTFDHPDLQAIWVASTLVEPGTDQQQQAFAVLDVDTTGPWQHLQWSRVRQEAARRVFRPSLINQQTLNVCGPATIAHMQADLDPVGYAAFVRQVFETATIDGDRANDELLANRPAHRVRSEEDMDHVDWMLLSCMRDTENAVFDYEGTPDEDFSAMTMPGEMAEWMEEVLGCVETEHYTSYLWGEISNARTVSNLMRAHGDGVVVAMLVDADALEKKDFTLNIPTHWIRLLQPIDIDTDADQITVQVYTWGSERTFVYDEDQFEDVLFEFVVGARRAGIDL